MNGEIDQPEALENWAKKRPRFRSLNILSSSFDCIAL